MTDTAVLSPPPGASRLEIDGAAYEPARLDRRAIEALHDAGILDTLGNVELVDGVLVRMSPSQFPHGAVIIALGAALLGLDRRRFRVVSDEGIFLGESLMRAPDICVLARGEAGGFHPARAVCLAVEVSQSTLQADLGVKAQEYAAHGIPEYWVVDVEGQRLHVHRGPGADGYAGVTAQGWGTALSPLCAPGFSFVPADALDGVL